MDQQSASSIPNASVMVLVGAVFNLTAVGWDIIILLHALRGKNSAVTPQNSEGLSSATDVSNDLSQP